MTKDRNNSNIVGKNPLRSIVNDGVGKKDNSNLAKFKELGVKKDSK